MFKTENIIAQLKEYKRPWKLVTFIIGLLLLILGSFYFSASDWDIPISFIMAVLTYLTASWCLRVIVKRRWKYFLFMFLFTWFSVDGCYWIYWKYENPIVLDLMREVNFLISLPLYLICGFVWYFKGTLKELFNELGNIFHK